MNQGEKPKRDWRKWYNRERQKKTMAKLETQRRAELAAGTLKCLCSRPAVTIKNKQGVCALCNDCELNSDAFHPQDCGRNKPDVAPAVLAQRVSPSPFCFPYRIGALLCRVGMNQAVLG